MVSEFLPYALNPILNCNIQIRIQFDQDIVHIPAEYRTQARGTLRNTIYQFTSS